MAPYLLLTSETCIFFFHIHILWMVPHLWVEVTVSGDWRTKYIWIQYILLLLWHLLASLLPPFICPTKLHCVVSQNDPWSLVIPLHRLLCCVFLFYMNTANKDKGKLFWCSWQWHVWGGTALHQLFLNLGFRWRWVVRFLMLQPLFHQTKNSWYHWIWGWVGHWTSLNVL